MPGRVLNFSEFAGKYSSDDEKTLDSFTQSSNNFEEGFDKESYNQKPIGPNKPVNTGIEMTPPQPGAVGSPKFTSDVDSDLNAPEEIEAPADSTEEEEPVDQEETEEVTEPAEKEETEDKDVPEPETGANPKTVEESYKVKNFRGFLNEESHNEYLFDADWKEEEDDFGFESPFCKSCEGEGCEGCDGSGMKRNSVTKSNNEFCSNCDAEYDKFGATCGCNM